MDLPHGASGRLPNVSVAICGIYKPRRRLGMGTRCPVSIRAAVYELGKNNRLTPE